MFFLSIAVRSKYGMGTFTNRKNPEGSHELNLTPDPTHVIDQQVVTGSPNIPK